jgi:hypothetical protein
MFRERSHCRVLVLWQRNDERDVYMDFGSRDVNVSMCTDRNASPPGHLTINSSSYLFSLTSPVDVCSWSDLP